MLLARLLLVAALVCTPILTSAKTATVPNGDIRLAARLDLPTKILLRWLNIHAQ